MRALVIGILLAGFALPTQAQRPGTGLTLLMDRDSKVVGEWPVRGLPTTFVVDPEGRLVYRAIGGRTWDDPALLDQVRALRSEAAAPEQPLPTDRCPLSKDLY